MPIKSKVASFIIKAIIESSCLILANSWPSQVKYLPINQILFIFDDNNLTQYLKNIATYKEYSYLIKYFHY